MRCLTHLAAKTLLQQSGELGVPVRDVAVVVYQGCDHTTEGQKTLMNKVDVWCRVRGSRVKQ
jgi:hypothetical protein